MDAVAPRLKPPLGMPRRLLRLRSDAFLAERFSAGDEAAFAMLYERHRASVLAVCTGVLGSKHDAEDAAQDAFAALAVSLREHPPRELRAWLARVARNAAIDIARRRRRMLSTDGEVPDVPAATSGGRAELENVLAGIRELPESQRTALLMRELGGHSYIEIATLLETDEEAVRGLIARARMSLRTHREAAELSCASARATLAGEPGGTKGDKTVRRHVRGCAPCRAYKQALRDDARALRGIIPLPAAGVGGGGALVGGLAAKSALVGGALTQVTAACAVSVCAVGGVVLLYPSPRTDRAAPSPAVHAGPRAAVAATHGARAPAGSTHRSRSDPTAGPRASWAGGTAGSTGSVPGTRSASRSWTRGSSKSRTATISGSGASPRSGSPAATGSGGSADLTDPPRPTGPMGTAHTPTGTATDSSGRAGPPGAIGATGGSGSGASGSGASAGSSGGAIRSLSPTGFQASGRQPASGPGAQAGFRYQRSDVSTASGTAGVAFQQRPLGGASGQPAPTGEHR